MKTKILKIKFTKEQQDEIDLINKGQAVPKTKTVTNKNGMTYDNTFNKRFSCTVARRRLLELYGGLCRCGEWPAIKIMYNVGDKNQGAWLVERYCQKCFDKREINWKKKKN